MTLSLPDFAPLKVAVQACEQNGNIQCLQSLFVTKTRTDTLTRAVFVNKQPRLLSNVLQTGFKKQHNTQCSSL